MFDQKESVPRHLFGRIESEPLTEILPYLWGIAYNILGNTHDAEDAVQETVCRFLEKKPAMIEPNKWRAYISSMVANHCLDMVRKKKRTVLLEDWEKLSEDVLPCYESPDFAQEPDIELGRWLARLPPKDRLILDFFYRERRSLDEIAEILGDSLGAVKVRLHRARKALKNMAQKEGIIYERT